MKNNPNDVSWCIGCSHLKPIYIRYDSDGIKLPLCKGCLINGWGKIVTKNKPVFDDEGNRI